MVFSVYELYQSLVSSGETYTYDMYTAVEEHTYFNYHGEKGEVNKELISVKSKIREGESC